MSKNNDLSCNDQKMSMANTKFGKKNRTELHDLLDKYTFMGIFFIFIDNIGMSSLHLKSSRSFNEKFSFLIHLTS